MPISKVLTQKYTYLAILLIVVLTSIVYANSLKNLFAWDDYIIIVDNDFVKSWKNFPQIFNRGYLAPDARKGYLISSDKGSGEMTYRPLVTISYFIDYSLWRLNPFGYHLTNLLLHIVNLLLLYLLIGLITRDKKIALLTALLFGLHPINSEAVNAIAFREDLLAFLFLVSSLILFIKSDSYPPKKRFLAYCASVSLYLLALFSKEMAITLPVLLILYDYYFLFQKKPKGILSNLKSRYLGYILASLFYLGVWFFLIGDIGKTLMEYPGGSFYTNILTMSKAVANYIKWLFIPVGIHATLPYHLSYVVDSFFSLEGFLSVSLIIACLVLAIRLRKRAKIISFAIFWFFIALLPVLNIVPIVNIMASRYLYIPGVGFCLLLAIFLVRLPDLRAFSISPDTLRRISREVAVLVLIFYSAFTVIRNFAWRNSITFWLEIAEHYPDNAKVHRELASWFIKNDQFDKAIEECKQAIDLDPNLAMAYSDLGLCYGKKGLYQEAIGCFKEAIKLEPKCVQAYSNLSIAYVKTANYNKAKKTMEKLLEIDPGYQEARISLEELKRLTRKAP